MTPKCPDCRRDQEDCICFPSAKMKRTIDRQAAQIEMMRQQLASAIAACKLKDEALQHYAGLAGDDAFNNYLAIHALNNKPDDDALKAWIGEPVAWMITYDGKCMGFVPTEEANTVAVYSPKGLK